MTDVVDGAMDGFRRIFGSDPLGEMAEADAEAFVQAMLKTGLFQQPTQDQIDAFKADYREFAVAVSRSAESMEMSREGGPAGPVVAPTIAEILAAVRRVMEDDTAECEFARAVKDAEEDPDLIAEWESLADDCAATPQRPSGDPKGPTSPLLGEWCPEPPPFMYVDGGHLEVFYIVGDVEESETSPNGFVERRASCVPCPADGGWPELRDGDYGVYFDRQRCEAWLRVDDRLVVLLDMEATAVRQALTAIKGAKAASKATFVLFEIEGGLL